MPESIKRKPLPLGSAIRAAGRGYGYVKHKKPVKRHIVKLSTQEIIAIDEYLCDFNKRRALAVAGYPLDMDAVAFFSRPLISSAVSAAKARRLDRAEIEQDYVLKRWIDLEKADPNEICSIEIDACRYCHGPDHSYQFTPEEFRQVIATEDRGSTVRRAIANYTARDVDPDAVPYQAAAWFDPKRGPAQDCPECHGRGVVKTVFHDTRKLSAAGQMLYLGVRVTRNGVEPMLRSQEHAHDMLSRHVGGFETSLRERPADGWSIRIEGGLPQAQLPPPAQMVEVVIEDGLGEVADSDELV